MALAQSPESIAITDLDGCIEYVNDALVLTSGHSREELIGKNLRLLKSGKTPTETYVALWNALTHGQIWAREYFLVYCQAASGARKHFSLTCYGHGGRRNTIAPIALGSKGFAC